MRKSCRYEKGVVLFVVLGVILMTATLAAVVLSLIVSHHRLTHHQSSRIQAYYAAQAAMNYAVEKLRNGTDPSWPANGTYTRNLCRANCTGPGDINDPNFPGSIQGVTIRVGAPDANNVRQINITANYTAPPE